MSKDTRKKKGHRELILTQWFEDLKQDGLWKQFVNNNGNLKLAVARRRLYTIETGKKGAWDNNYFKVHHWSYDAREDFEKWVATELARRPDYDLFGGQLKSSLDLPRWLEDGELPEGVLKLLIELVESRKSDKDEIKGLKSKLDKRDQKILELSTMLQNLDHRHASIDDHYTASVRTLRYNAGMDIDLSKEDLFSMGWNDATVPRFFEV